MADDGGWARSPVVGVVVGTFVGGLCVFLGEAVGHALFGTGNPADPASLTQAMFVSVLVTWTIASAVAGTVATWWTRARPVWPGVVAGLVLLAGAVSNMVAFPHPVWLQVAAVVLMPLAAFAAARWFAGRSATAPPAAA